MPRKKAADSKNARAGKTAHPKSAPKKVDTATGRRTSPKAQPTATSGPVGPAPFFVVGVGASAGGLEAIGALLKHATLENMALVIVQHLAPQHLSVLPEILSRTSRSPVLLAQDGMKVEPNNIYVIPPNADLAILHGVLHVMAQTADRGVRLPIDYFLRSLAADQGSRAIGVILSGTGSDGTFGLRAIKSSGGITFAQDPASARYDGMPLSAIESGCADFTLTPESIAEELLKIGQHPYLAKPPAPQLPESIGKLLVLIRAAFGNDLTFYKPSTIDRRVERRMALHKIEKLDDYVRFVQSSADELRLLYKDMLISVTSFFRDTDPFDALKTKALPRVMAGKKVGAQLRVWVPACSTGEEAYSIAMSLLEYLGDKAQDFRIQIFGTDIDESSIQHARRGIYAQNIELDVSPERLRRFFVKRDAEYQVSRRLRDMVVFSVQNVTRDAPFSRLDLVSCRNLFIYLQPVIQRKVLRILHYALNPAGHLMLGTSETVGESSDLFSLLDRKNKIYSRRPGGASAVHDIGFGVQAEPAVSAQAATIRRQPANIPTLVDRTILEMYGPPGVVINEDLDVVHIRGRTGPYLDPMPGAPSFNLLKLARPELHLELRRSIHEAQSTNAPVTANCRIGSGGESRQIKLEVIPIIEPEARTKCLLILFHELGAPSVGTEKESAALTLSPEAARMHELERELTVTKEYLQSTVEELETTNEELKSSNEELQSSNEELQSTNEELETSKEELQSTNEELTSVNDELKNHMEDLQQTHDDLYNVMSGVGNAVVIVGMDLRIRRCTPTAEKLLNLVSGDVGRPVAIMNVFVTGLEVEKLTATVIERLAPLEQQVLCADHRWYDLRITPYRTQDHTINGAVILLVDIHVQKQAMELGKNVAEYAERFLGGIRHPLMIVDQKQHVLWASDTFFAIFQVVPEETIGNFLPRLGTGQWASPKLTASLEAVAVTGKAFKDVQIRYAFPDIGDRTFRVSGSRVPATGGDSILILLAFEEMLTVRSAELRETTARTPK